MRINLYFPLLFGLLTLTGIFLSGEIQSQTSDIRKTINFPLPHEDLSLYNFAEIRFETDKTEKPPAGLAKKNFQPVKEIFQKDSLYFTDSIQTVWFKLNILNNLASDTSVALIFPGGVNKAVLYKTDGERLIFLGKTGFTLAVIARTIPYEDARIDMLLKAQSNAIYFVQIPRIGFGYMLNKTPILKGVHFAEMKAFDREMEIRRPELLWSHFFTGVFFMFFVFGFIKYKILGKDKAYLYYALLGLANAFLAITQAEYPPFELPSFENLRGIELFNLVNGVAIVMQGLFILEILQLKTKYPRITLATKWFLFLQLLIPALYTAIWIINKQYGFISIAIYPYHQLLTLLVMFIWVVYLATIREGFYRFIFLGALTIFIAFTLYFLVQFFNLYYLLPDWVLADKRGSVNHFMQIALLIDMCFYFTGLAYRDRQVEKDKIIFQEQLIQQLEANKELQEQFTSKLKQQVQEKTTELIEQRRALEIEKEAKLLADFNRKFSESELKALRSQMNPHFVFNILNTIESFSLENNKEAVSAMIQKFSRLTRLVLENSMNQLVPFENDWKSLQLYIELEQMRYADKFLAIYNVQDKILEGEYFIPPMIIQPFVENAIIHGLRIKANDKGILSLSASLQNGHIIVLVEDNGIGRVKSAQLRSNNPIQKTSLGIKVTQDRISIFNNLNPDKKAKVEIQDLSEGTRVVISLPATN
jgi:two-component system, LytTR family, sensor kinase